MRRRSLFFMVFEEVFVHRTHRILVSSFLWDFGRLFSMAPSRTLWTWRTARAKGIKTCHVETHSIVCWEESSWTLERYNDTFPPRWEDQVRVVGFLWYRKVFLQPFDDLYDLEPSSMESCHVICWDTLMYPQRLQHKVWSQHHSQKGHSVMGWFSRPMSKTRGGQRVLVLVILYDACVAGCPVSLKKAAGKGISRPQSLEMHRPWRAADRCGLVGSAHQDGAPNGFRDLAASEAEQWRPGPEMGEGKTWEDWRGKLDRRQDINEHTSTNDPHV